VAKGFVRCRNLSPEARVEKPSGTTTAPDHGMTEDRYFEPGSTAAPNVEEAEAKLKFGHAIRRTRWRVLEMS